jgi:hypothetical protein
LPKKKIEKPQREMTHRQLTHWQKEKRLQRITFIAGIIIIVAIIAVVGTGFYMAKYKPLHQTVLKIGDNEFDMNYMINTLAYMGVKNANPSYTSMYASFAVQTIEQNYFLVEAASKLDPPITVTDDEVTKYIKDNKLSKDKARQDAVRGQLVTEKLKSDHFSQMISAKAEHRAVWAMLLESQGQANDVKVRLDNGEKFADIAAELSLDNTTKDKKGDLGWLPQGVLSTVLTNEDANAVSRLDSKIFDPSIVKNELTSFTDDALIKKIGYWLIKVTDIKESENQAHIYAMLLGSSQQGEDIISKLIAGGDGNDWDTLAKANSQYDNASANGGDLGYKAKGDLGDAVDTVIFDKDGKVIVAKDTLIGPLADSTMTTKGSTWLIQVNGTEQQTISDANRTILINSKFTTWFEDYWTANKDRIIDSFNPDQQDYAFKEAMKR